MSAFYCALVLLPGAPHSQCKGFVRTANGHEDGHLSHAIIDQTQQAGIESIGDKQRAWATIYQAVADAHKQGGSNRSSDGDHLDLAVAEVALEAVRIAGEFDAAIAFIVWREWRRFLFVAGRGHVACLLEAGHGA